MFNFNILTMLLLTMLTFFTFALASPLLAREEAAVDTDGPLWARSIEVRASRFYILFKFGSELAQLDQEPFNWYEC